jgi:hypothetical protein
VEAVLPASGIRGILTGGQVVGRLLVLLSRPVLWRVRNDLLEFKETISLD